MDAIFGQLSVSPQAGVTIAHQLKQQITWLVASGQLKAGDRLPPVRQLAAQLSINLHTVRSAYLQLEAEGLLETIPGRGTHVLGYDPRRIAQAASLIRSHTIGVILPSLENPFYHGFLQGVDQVADRDQTLLFVCNTEDDPGEAMRYYAQLAAKQVDGLLVVSHGIADLFSAGSDAIPRQIPLVTVDWPGSEGYSVEIDLENAGYLATRHLLEHGHRRVGLVTFINDIANVRPINEGYRRALVEAGVEPDPALLARVVDFKFNSGMEGARRLLALPQPPTAIFAIADTLALGVMHFVLGAGLRVPQDIALVGFNDIPSAAMLQPPLTTLAAHPEQLGFRAMGVLQKLIGGRRPAQRRLVLPVDLVVRQSCGSHEPSGESLSRRNIEN